ncbi:MAG: hypothetical protein M1825_000405 [Sarcosagium campestre]|nr:MAG: hypothetical protein M1825_000405 [Sarcosagium campestre]
MRSLAWAAIAFSLIDSCIAKNAALVLFYNGPGDWEACQGLRHMECCQVPLENGRDVKIWNSANVNGLAPSETMIAFLRSASGTFPSDSHGGCNGPPVAISLEKDRYVENWDLEIQLDAQGMPLPAVSGMLMIKERPDKTFFTLLRKTKLGRIMAAELDKKYPAPPGSSSVCGGMDVDCSGSADQHSQSQSQGHSPHSDGSTNTPFASFGDGPFVGGRPPGEQTFPRPLSTPFGADELQDGTWSDEDSDDDMIVDVTATGGPSSQRQKPPDANANVDDDGNNENKGAPGLSLQKAPATHDLGAELAKENGQSAPPSANGGKNDDDPLYQLDLPPGRNTMPAGTSVDPQRSEPVENPNAWDPLDKRRRRLRNRSS